MRASINEGQRVVTTKLVVAETHALVMRRAGRTTALAFARTVDMVPNVVVRSPREIETAAIRDWLGRYADHDFSLNDAISFAVMKERGIRDALTVDNHFVVADSRALPAFGVASSS